MPRATFPTPDDKENKEIPPETEGESDSASITSSNASVESVPPKNKLFKKPKVFSVKTTKSGKVNL